MHSSDDRPAVDGVPGRRDRRRRKGAARGGSGDPAARIAYVRVSTAREDMVSPEIQEQAIRVWAVQRGLRIVDVVSDLDISGRGFAARQVGRIIERIEAGEAAGGVVESATEPVDAESAIGRFTRTTALAIAELQSDQLGDGWRAAADRRVRAGLAGSGQPRWGYVYHRATTATRTCPRGCAVGGCTTGHKVDPTTGPILARLYRDYLAGTGLPTLAERLNSDRVPTLRGGRWATTTLRDMLDSGFGAALLWHRGEWAEGAHEPVIDRYEWAAYVARRQQAAAQPSRHRTPVHPYAGIAACGLCGAGLTAHRSGSAGRGQPRRYQLKCGKNQVNGRGLCPGVWIAMHTVEAAVLEWLKAYAEPIRQATEQAVRRRPRPIPRTDNERARLERRLTDLRKRVDRLTDALESGALPVTDYKTRRQALDADVRTVQLDLARAAIIAPAPPPAELVHDLITGWDKHSAAARRDVLAALISRVVVYPRYHQPRIVIEGRWT